MSRRVRAVLVATFAGLCASALFVPMYPQPTGGLPLNLQAQLWSVQPVWRAGDRWTHEKFGPLEARIYWPGWGLITAAVVALGGGLAVALQQRDRRRESE